MKNQVKASNFINWRFSDHEDVEDFGHVVVNKLMKNGSYSINARELFYLCGYIPQFICEDADGDEEYFPADLEFIDDITK